MQTKKKMFFPHLFNLILNNEIYLNIKAQLNCNLWQLLTTNMIKKNTTIF